MFKNVKIASKIFQTHRTRTILSILGILIGITSVIVIINAGQSLEEFIMDQVEVFGTDYIEVEIKVPNHVPQGVSEGQSKYTIEFFRTDGSRMRIVTGDGVLLNNLSLLFLQSK